MEGNICLYYGFIASLSMFHYGNFTGNTAIILSIFENFYVCYYTFEYCVHCASIMLSLPVKDNSIQLKGYYQLTWDAVGL